MAGIGGSEKIAAKIAGGKHEERRRMAKLVCAKAQKIGGKREERHRVGRTTARMKERSAAAAKFANAKAKRIFTTVALGGFAQTQRTPKKEKGMRQIFLNTNPVKPV